MVNRAALLEALRLLKQRDALDNREGDFWDVFPAVDDPQFSPLVAGTAENSLWWTSEDDRSVRADDGALLRPLAFSWRGDWTALQLAFARAGLSVRLELPEPDQYELRTRLGLLSPRSDTARCDLLRLLAAFRDLRSRDVIALERAGNTQSEGWEDVAAAGPERRTAVFWHAQSHEAFDGLGQLSRPMYLYWRGDAQAIVQALREQGLGATAPDSPGVGIEVVGAGADGTAPDLEPLAPPVAPPPRPPEPAPPGEQLLEELARSSPSAGPELHQPGHEVGLLRLAPDGERVLCVAAGPSARSTSQRTDAS